MKDLTERVIKELFVKTGVEEKYFSYYEAELKRRHKAFREEYPYDENEDEEERAEDEKIEKACIECANDYIRYYVEEREKGHGHKWAHFYALDSPSDDVEYRFIHGVLDKIDDEEKAEELTIHAKSINKDPIFVERFKYILENSNCNYSEKAEEYCRAYHKCIEEGKSVTYAHAYADAVNNGFQRYSGIYAEAYELAKNHGMKDDNAVSFAVYCKCAAENGLYSEIEIENLKKIYREKWQREFYLQLIEEEHKTKLSEDDIISLKNRLEIPIMGEREIKNLIEELRHKSGQERRYGAEKCSYYDSVADYIEGNINSYKDDRFETEEDIIEDVKEVFDESDSFWNDIDEDELDNYEIQ